MKDIKGISTGRDPFPVRVEPKKMMQETKQAHLIVPNKEF